MNTFWNRCYIAAAGALQFPNPHRFRRGVHHREDGTTSVTNGVLQAIVIGDQRKTKAEGQRQHVKVNIGKTGEVTGEGGCLTRLVQPCRGNLLPLDINRRYQHGTCRTEALQFLSLRRRTHAAVELVHGPMKQGCRIQNPLHGLVSRITSMKAPLTLIFIKEGGQRGP